MFKQQATSRQTDDRRQSVIMPDDLRREIERVIEDAKRGNRTLHTGNEARRLAELYPEAGIAHDDLCDEILALAIAARAPTQLNSAI